LSLRLLKGKYYIIIYYDRKTGKRTQEYIGDDRIRAYTRLKEVIEEKIAYWRDKLADAEKELVEP